MDNSYEVGSRLSPGLRVMRLAGRTSIGRSDDVARIASIAIKES